MKHFIIITATLLLLFGCVPTVPETLEVTNSDSSITTLSVVNLSVDTIPVYLTLGCGPLNIVNTAGIFGIQDTALQAYFILNPYDTLYYTPPINKILSGNITFNTYPQNCPDTIQFPTGINLFEFTLNNKVLGAGQQETIDISGVAGFNVVGCFNLVGGGMWNAGPDHPGLVFFKNNSFYNNSECLGVYPYGCDDCTASVSPPICPNHKPFAKPKKTATCNVQRPCTTSGGTVFIGYINTL